MTASIKSIGPDLLKYYMDLQREDYYVAGGEAPGHWWTRIDFAWEKQDLRRTVDRLTMANLLQGLSPDGTQALRRQQKYTAIHGRCLKVRMNRLGLDVTLSVPKCVSVLWACSPAEKRHTIEAIVQAAGHKTLAAIEREAAWTRRGHGGTRREHAKIIAAVFPHSVSRAKELDPQLHCHCVVFNIAQRADGSFGSLESHPIYEYKMMAGAIFRAEVARELRNQLGLTCRPATHGFTIDGIPDALCKHFSKRRTAIVERLKELGQTSAADAARVTLTTRQAKGKIPPREQLLERWQAEARAFGVTPETIAQLVRPDQDRPPIRTMDQIFASAAKTLTARQDAFTENDMARQVLNASIGSGLDPNSLVAAARKRVKTQHDFVQAPAPAPTRQTPCPPAEYPDRSSERLERSKPKVNPQVDIGLRAETKVQHTRPSGEIHPRQDRHSATAHRRPSRIGQPVPRASEPQSKPETLYMTREAQKLQSALAVRIDRLTRDRSFVLSDGAVARVAARYRQPRNCLAEEVKYHLSQFARATRSQNTFPIDRPLVSRQAQTTLDPAGRGLLYHLTQRPGRVVVVHHPNTNQRDLAITAAAAAYRKAGYEVLVASPFRRSAKELQQTTNASAMTHRKLQLKMHPTLSYQIKHHATQILRTALLQPTYRLKPFCIDPDKVLIVDQAHQMSLQDLSRLVRDVERHGGKLVLLAPPSEDFQSHRTALTATVLHDLAQSTWRQLNRHAQDRQSHTQTRSVPPSPSMEI